MLSPSPRLSIVVAGMPSRSVAPRIVIAFCWGLRSCSWYVPAAISMTSPSLDASMASWMEAKVQPVGQTSSVADQAELVMARVHVRVSMGARM